MPPSQRAQHCVGNRFRLGHASRAHHAASQRSGAGLDHAHASLAQNLQIGLRGRMLPHVHVHCWSHQHRRARGQVHGGEEVVGQAMGKLGQDVGCGGGDDERVGPLRLADVFNAVLFGRCGI